MPYKDKDKLREYQRLWKAQRRADYFSDKVCAVCGTIEDLELDHIDPSTKDPRLKTYNKSASIWSWSEANRLLELAKCQALCKEHHKEKTKAERK